jgi:arsenate reductase
LCHGCNHCQSTGEVRRVLRMNTATEQQPFNVLFLCTGNSARSILAEVTLNAIGGGRFKAYSAGSFPNGRVNPFAIELLESKRLPIEGLRSKSWDEFAKPGAPFIHFVFTVCDQAAAEPCPVWPGKPLTAHWGVPDPAAVEGSDEAKRKAFQDAFITLHRRISLFTALPVERLQGIALKEQLDAIGKTNADSSRPS